MQQWIINPRIHGPSLGNSPPSLSAGVSVDEWAGDEFPPPREPQVPLGFILLMQMEFGMEPGEET
jgi:hypothetical protein